MVDTVSKSVRSEIMRRVRSENTGPEVTLRRALFAKGLRYRLHYNHLPGKPDIVFPSAKLAVQVRGCFWHGHGCSRTRVPKSNTEFWKNKIDRNKARDAQSDRQLRKLGWTVLCVWECSIVNAPGLEKQTKRVIGALEKRRVP